MNEMKIHLMNKLTGTTVRNVPVLRENTLEQIAEAYGGELGIDSNGPLRFENKRSGQTRNDLACTIGEMGLERGDVLVICDDSIVG